MVTNNGTKEMRHPTAALVLTHSLRQLVEGPGGFAPAVPKPLYHQSVLPDGLEGTCDCICRRALTTQTVFSLTQWCRSLQNTNMSCLCDSPGRYRSGSLSKSGSHAITVLQQCSLHRLPHYAVDDICRVSAHILKQWFKQ